MKQKIQWQCNVNTSVTSVYYGLITWSQRNRVYAWISCGDARVQRWAVWSWIALHTPPQKWPILCRVER